MKLIAFVLLTLGGLLAGMVIGFASVPPDHWGRESRLIHLVWGAISGTVAGMAVCFIGFWLTNDKKKE